MTRKLFQIFIFITIVLQTATSSAEKILNNQEYLKKLGTVNVCVDPDWYPFEKIDDKGQYVGIGADMLKKVMNKAGIRYQIYRTADWNVTLKASQDGKCQIISMLNKTPEREKWLLFTEPHFTDPNVFVTRNDHSFISNPSYLYNETLVLPEGTSVEERIRKNFPNIRIITTESEKNAFKMVENKEADMTLRSQIMTGFYAKEKLFYNLKIAGMLPEYNNEFRIGVLKTEPQLTAILNQSIAKLTYKEKADIVNKYIITPAHKQNILRTQIIEFLIILLVLSVLWHFFRMNRMKKRIRNDIRESLDIGIVGIEVSDKMLTKELKRAHRYNKPLSIVLIETHADSGSVKPLHTDIILRFYAENVRFTDIVCRWEQNSILLIFTDTDYDGSVKAYERIHENMNQFLITEGISVKIYFGIATLQPEEDAGNLISRADTNLFLSKNK